MANTRKIKTAETKKITFKILDRYRKLREKEKELEKDLKELIPITVDFVNSKGGKIEYKGKVFDVRSKVTFAYSENIKNLEQQVKDAKKVEQLTKKATVTNVSESVYMTDKNEKKENE